jgi:hypothetical protein
VRRGNRISTRAVCLARLTPDTDGWEGHSPEVLRDMRDHLEKLKRYGIEAIND